MIRSIMFDPFLSIPVLVAMFAGAVGVLFFFRPQSLSAIVLRMAVFGLILLFLANPVISETQKASLDDIIIVLIDQSQSQTLDKRTEITQQAREQLTRKINEVGGIQIREVLTDPQSGSDLWSAYANTIANVPRARVAGTFILTDGQVTDRRVTNAPASAAPVNVLLTGRDKDTDRKLTLVDAPRYGIISEPLNIRFRIDDIGADEKTLPGTATARVTLKVDGKEVHSDDVLVGETIAFQAPMSKPGETIIEVSVSERPGELSTINNTAILPIVAIRDRLRVLLISGEPHAGERAWRNLLKSDPAIDLVHFTILRPIEKAQSDGAFERELALIEFPQDELFIEKLTEFDLLIFDRYTYRGVLNAFHFDNIGRYVEEGGAVFVSAGPEFDGYQSLAARRNFSFILPALPAGPAVETPFRAEFSSIGSKHPATSGLSESEFWGRWLRIMPASKRSGKTLLTGPDDTPLLILDRVGKGRVGLLLSDHVWLWARGFDGGGPHAELLRRVSHWLMKEPDLEEEQLALSEVDGDLIVQRQTIEDRVNAVDITFPDGSTISVSPRSTPTDGIYQAIVEHPPKGLYEAKADNLFAIGIIGKSQETEFRDIVSNASKLFPIAEESSGGIFKIRNGDTALLPNLTRTKNTKKGVPENRSSMPILDRQSSKITAVKSKPLASPFTWLLLLGTAIFSVWLIESNRLKFNSAKKTAHFFQKT